MGWVVWLAWVEWGDGRLEAVKCKKVWCRFPDTFSTKLKLSDGFPNSDGGAFAGRGSISRIWMVAVGQGGSGPKPPDVNELGQWSGQWRPPEPALVAPGTRARTMRRRRIGSAQASSTTFLLTPPPPGLAFPAPACLLCTGAASALHRAARLLAGLNPLSLSLAVGRRTCLVPG